MVHRGDAEDAERIEDRRLRIALCSILNPLFSALSASPRLFFCAQVEAEQAGVFGVHGVAGVLVEVEQAVAQDGQGPGFAGSEGPAVGELLVALGRKVQEQEVAVFAEAEEAAVGE